MLAVRELPQCQNMGSDFVNEELKKSMTPNSKFAIARAGSLRSLRDSNLGP